MLPAVLRRLSVEVLAAYRERGWRLATAESCTGGLIAGALTASVGRAVDWIHAPAGQGEPDAAYYEPLRELHLPPE